MIQQVRTSEEEQDLDLYSSQDIKKNEDLSFRT